MHLVIDSSAMRQDELREFFSRSQSNKAVLTDYSAMEAYSGDSLEKIYRSMSVVSDYPRQVVVLKATSKVAGLNGKEKGLRRRLVDQHQTSEFGKFVTDLRKAQNGSRPHQQALLQMGAAAREHLDEKMLGEMCGMGAAIQDFSNVFDSDEIKALRNGSDLPAGCIDKLVKFGMTVAADMFGRMPGFKKLPALPELPNTFPFRVSIAGVIMMATWIEKGGHQSAPDTKFRNDFVDCMFAAYATYFDGLMTRDKRLRSIYDTTNALIEICRRTMKN